MTEREAYVAFNLTERVGVVTLTELIARYGSAAAAWSAYPTKVSRAGGEVDVEREFALAKKYGVSLLTLADPDYPKILRDSPGAPLVLYVKGDVGALSTDMVALIGTRRATQYGKAIANRLAYDLVKAGWGIVSGLALGIDGEAHRGAVDADGITVGVLGSALDRFYPEENRELAREIVAKGGAVVSQFPFGRGADTTTFPIRNHVVAALAKGVVAVECPSRSGTLITTGQAADLGRVVMSVPGRVDSKMSRGCLNLIREGAVLVRDVDDVLEALNPFGSMTHSPAAADAEVDVVDQPPPYSAEEALMMLNIADEGTSIDELARLTELPVAKVNALAMGLRIKGFVRFLPGNRLAPSNNRRA